MITKAQVRKYKDLLDYLPDEVVVEIAGKEFDMSDAEQCLCGWALRSMVGRIVGTTADYIENVGHTSDGWGDEVEGSTPYVEVPEYLALLVGGKKADWSRLFTDVTDSSKLVAIEVAFGQRLNDAIERLSVPSPVGFKFAQVCQ